MIPVYPLPDLKPCQKCGGVGEIQQLPGFPDYKVVVCTNRTECKHRTPIGPGLFRAVSIWNGEKWADPAQVVTVLYDLLQQAVTNPMGAWRTNAADVLELAERSMQP